MRKQTDLEQTIAELLARARSLDPDSSQETITQLIHELMACALAASKAGYVLSAGRLKQYAAKLELKLAST